MAPPISSAKPRQVKAPVTAPPPPPKPATDAKAPKAPSPTPAGDDFATKRPAALPQPPPPAVPPSKVTAEARNSWTLDFTPAIKDEAAARQAIFGSDKVPDGLMLTQKKDFLGEPVGGWTVTVLPDETKQAPNNIPWEKYQAGVRPEVQSYLSKNLPANLNVPKPGQAAVKLPEYFAAEKAAAEEKAKQFKVTGWGTGMQVAETLGGLKSIDVTSYDVSFNKPMTRAEVQQFFWEQKKTPMNSSLVPVPANAKMPAKNWRVTQPNHHTTDYRAKGIDVFLQQKMNAQLSKENFKRPEWIGPKTAAALANKSLPPKGVEVQYPKPGIAVWREGDGVFWYDKDRGSFQAFGRTGGDGVGSKMWNNWNTSYIMDQGMSPKEAGPRVVQDMHEVNRQMLFAFAAALSNAETPAAGWKGALKMANEVSKDFGGPGLQDKGDLIKGAYDAQYPTKPK